MVIVPEVGANVLPLLIVKLPLTEKLAVGWEEGVSAMVKPEKTKVPELIMVQPLVFIVIVPPEGERLPETFKVLLIVKSLEVLVVPLTVRLLKTKFVVLPPLLTIEPPVMVIVPAVGAKVFPELMVKAPEIEKSAVGWEEGVSAMVKPEKTRVPELLIAQDVPVIVMVPLLGERFLPLLMVKVPLIEKLAVG